MAPSSSCAEGPALNTCRLFKLQAYLRGGLGFAEVDPENEPRFYSITFPFGFGADDWIYQSDGWNLALEADMTTYIVDVSNQDLLPNNSVLTPWVLTFGIRVKI